MFFIIHYLKCWGIAQSETYAVLVFFLKIEYGEGSHLTYRIIIQVNMVTRNGGLAGSGPYVFHVTRIAYSRVN